MNPFQSWPVWLRENFGALYALCALALAVWFVAVMAKHFLKTGRGRLRPPFQYTSPDHSHEDRS